MRRVVIVIGLCVAAVGCGPPPKDPAVVAYEQFVAALRGRDPLRVWQGLAPDSQARLAELLGLPKAPSVEAVQARLGVRPGWGFELDLPQQARLDPAGSDELRRVVVGPLAGAPRRIPMIRVGDTWRVDLFAAAPASGGTGQGIDPRPGTPR
ncbi:MAG: hypothetical protein H6702_13225 [Myxococcales bacterium]|nr:hypothetical protein [Myxococcales bacterium]